MIVNPQLSVDYDFKELSRRVRDKDTTIPEITNIYDYYKNLEKIKGALTPTDLGFLYAPLKEPYLEIDANTRTINIPNIFVNNGIGVEGDHYAETLCFQINRYFDTIDLSNTTVYIHWMLNEGGERKEGKDNAYFVDSIAKKDYLIIGWPLNRNKFATFGTLKFYLSFEIGTQYILNTLSATVKINKKLDLPAEQNDETNYNDFPYVNSSITSLEMSAPPETSLIYDIQSYTVGESLKNISGPRKENLINGSLTIAAQFKNNSGSTLIVKFVKDGEESIKTPSAEGIVTADISTPGSYYFTAQSSYGDETVATKKIKTSTISVMKPLTPIFDKVKYVNTLPDGVEEINHKVIYLNDTQNDNDILATVTITGLDYSTDTSKMSAKSSDYGTFKLVPYWASEVGEVPVAHNDKAYDFEDLTLSLTKAQLETIYTDKTSLNYSLKVVHSLNGDTNITESPIDISGITKTIVPLFLNSLREQNTLTLSINNGSFILTKNHPGYTGEWQYYKDRSWNTEENITTNDWYIGSKISNYEVGQYVEADRQGLINAIMNNYRINLIAVSTDGLTKTCSTILSNSQLIPNKDFYKVIISTNVIPVIENTDDTTGD